MTKFIKLLFLLFVCQSFSQKSLTIDSSLSERDLVKAITYYHDKESKENIESIQSKVFSSFDGSFLGVQEQQFWFKLKLNKIESKQNEFFFLIKSVAIERLVLYQNIGQGYEKIYEFSENGIKKLEIPFPLIENSTFIFKVFFTKSIYFPISIEDSQSLQETKTRNLVYFGFYYGFAFIVLLINLFLYLQTKERFFILYILLALSIVLILLELDGFAFWLVGNASWITQIDVVLHTFLLISLMLFTTEVLQLKTHLPKLKWVGGIIVLLNTFSFLIYLSTDTIFWYSLGEIFNAIGLLLYWFTGILLFRKLLYARFLFIGYTVLFISNVIYVLPSEFGMIDLGFSPKDFKIGSIIEMSILLYAISFRYKMEVEKRVCFEEKSLNQEKKLNQIELSKEKIDTNSFKEFNLTKREREVILMLIDGHSNKEIAELLFVSESTVKFHVTNIFTKTNTSKRVELIKKYK